LPSGGEGHLTLLGDLGDRGPDTVGSYRAAYRRPAAEMGFSGRTGLAGNHEALLKLGILGPDDQDVWPLWMQNGGRTVLAEIGCPVGGTSHDSAAGALRAALGETVCAELDRLSSHREAGNLLFVHAGVDPLQPLAAWFAKPLFWLDNEDHFAWIRFPFLGHEGPFEGDRIVVHGHTPEPIVRRWKGMDATPGQHGLDGWRLGLDGGTYTTGIVAGAEIRDGSYRIYLAA